MHINSVTVSNFKLGDAIHRPGPLTAIVGPNFAGKTSIADAIRVGLLGYSPAHGKVASAVWGFAGIGDEMRIALGFSDGTEITRIWRSRRGSIQTCDPLFLGQPPVVPPVMLDLRDYLGRTGPQRVKFIFELVDADKLCDAKQIVERLKADVPANVRVDHAEILAEAIEQVEECDRETTGPIQELFNVLLGKYKAERDDAKKTAGRMAGMIQAEASLDRQLEPPQNLEPKIKALLEEAKQLNQTAGRERQANEEAAREIEAIKQAQNKTDGKIGKAMLKRLGDLAQEWKALDDVITAYKSSFPKTDKALEAARSNQTKTAENLAAIEALANAEPDPEVNLDTLPLCKDCRHAITKELKQRKQAKAEHYRKVKADRDKAYAADQRALEALDSARRDRKKAMEEDNRMEQASQKRGQIFNDMDAGKRELAEWQKLASSEPPKIIHSDAEARATAIESEIEQLRQRQRAYDEFVGAERRKQQAREEHDEATARVLVYGACLDVLQSLLSAINVTAFNTFLEKANLFTKGILRAPLEFHEGEIGYMTKAGAWVSLDYFSGTEQLIAHAGLSVALALQSPFKLVICDELGRLEYKVKQAFAERVRDLIDQKLIDQAILIDVDASAYINGETVIRIS